MWVSFWDIVWLIFCCQKFYQVGQGIIELFWRYTLKSSSSSFCFPCSTFKRLRLALVIIVGLDGAYLSICCLSICCVLCLYVRCQAFGFHFYIAG